MESLGSVALERTNATGLRHTDGALSMARSGPDTATASFSIVIGDQPEMDFGGKRNADGQGFAVTRRAGNERREGHSGVADGTERRVPDGDVGPADQNSEGAPAVVPSGATTAVARVDHGTTLGSAVLGIHSIRSGNNTAMTTTISEIT